MVNRQYTLREEIFNASIHGIGVGFGITALVILLVFSVQQNDIWKIVSSALFGSSLIIMYSASTLYHSFFKSRWKSLFKILDHAAIYFLIAGSYTPFALVTLRGDFGWILFGVVWGLALFGVLFKIFFVYRFKIVSIASYLLMGWLAVLAIVPLYHHLARGGLFWLILGGLCYTFGAVFYLWKSAKYTHTIWHVFVVAGSVCHFFSVLWYVILPN